MKASKTRERFWQDIIVAYVNSGKTNLNYSVIWADKFLKAYDERFKKDRQRN